MKKALLLVVALGLVFMGVRGVGEAPVALADDDDNTVIEESSKSKAHLLTLFLIGGRPKNLDTNHDVTVLINTGFAVGFSEHRRSPLWSAYHVDAISARVAGRDETVRIKHDRPDQFFTDVRTSAQVDGSQTFGFPYDRGHMTPNNAIQMEFGRLAQLETFFMSNMVPQHGDLNSGLWRDLEHAITSDLVKRWNDIWVIAGPIYGTNPPLSPRQAVPVPKDVYMIIGEQYYDRGRRKTSYDAIAFRFPNGDTGSRKLWHFVTDIDSIESATSLDFFPDLDESINESDKSDYFDWFD